MSFADELRKTSSSETVREHKNRLAEEERQRENAKSDRRLADYQASVEEFYENLKKYAMEQAKEGAHSISGYFATLFTGDEAGYMRKYEFVLHPDKKGYTYPHSWDTYYKSITVDSFEREKVNFIGKNLTEKLKQDNFRKVHLEASPAIKYELPKATLFKPHPNVIPVDDPDHFVLHITLEW